MKYRINKYLTWKGNVSEVSLPDSVYGEWIVYEHNVPKFHVNIFNADSKSDCLIFIVLNEKDCEIEEILTDINNRNNRNLTTKLKKKLGVKLKTKMQNFDVKSLPFSFVEHYAEAIIPPWKKFPDHDPNDMFWRMGNGENLLYGFARYYNALDNDEKKEFKIKHKPPIEWSDFYE